MTASAPVPDDHGGMLRRELRFWEAIALSIAIMAPTAAMALNGTVPASLVGRAVPLAFIFATIGVIFVSWAFIRLTSNLSHAGSVYAFSGVTLGPRAGFFSGWAILGTYLAFTAEAGLFGVAFFQGSGIWDGAEWLVIALVAGALIALLAYGDIRVATRSLLGLEGTSLADLVNLGATISAFASGLGTATAGSRILFALSRDGFGSRRLGQASRRTGALAVVMAIGLTVVVVQRIIGTSAANAFFYPGTIGVLSLLVAYIVTNVGAIRFLFVAARRAPLWQVVIPLIAIVFLGYTIYKNIEGTSFPYDRFPFVVGAWLVVGLCITVVFPGLTRNIGARLAAREGLAREA